FGRRNDRTSARVPTRLGRKPRTDGARDDCSTVSCRVAGSTRWTRALKRAEIDDQLGEAALAPADPPAAICTANDTDSAWIVSLLAPRTCARREPSGSEGSNSNHRASFASALRDPVATTHASS